MPVDVQFTIKYNSAANTQHKCSHENLTYSYSCISLQPWKYQNFVYKQFDIALQAANAATFLRARARVCLYRVSRALSSCTLYLGKEFLSYEAKNTNSMV